MNHEQKLRDAFSKIKQENNKFRCSIERMEDNQKQILNLLQEKRQQPKPTGKVFTKLNEKRITKEFACSMILKLIEENKSNLRATELQKEAEEKYGIKMKTFYNALEVLKLTQKINPNPISKRYSIIKQEVII